MSKKKRKMLLSLKLRNIFSLKKAVIGLGVISVIYFLIFFPTMLKVKSIYCYYQERECNEVLKKHLSSLQGKNLKTARSEINLYLKNEKIVKSYSLQYKLPSNLVIFVLEKRPLYSLSNNNSEWLSLVTEEGEVSSISTSTDLPKVEIKEKLPNPGEVVNKKTLFALELNSALKKYYNIQKAYIDNEKLVIELIGGMNVIFPIEGDKERLLGAFVLIESELKKNLDKNDGKIGTIDLRFKNPVVKID